MSRRIAVLGLSGVGKSTLIGKVHQSLPLLHLQASSLIKAEQAYRMQNSESSEELRKGAVVDNQALMIAAFRRAVATTNLPIILDGHSVIDGRDGLIEIPSLVFGALALDVICFLAEKPDVIAERRRADTTRERPYRDVATLRDHQRVAKAVARRIAQEIECPFVYIANGEIDRLRELLS